MLKNWNDITLVIKPPLTMAHYDALFKDGKVQDLSQVELADLCSVLYDAYFNSNPHDNNIATKYNIAAAAYNKNAGAAFLTAITPSTVQFIPNDAQDELLIPAEKLINKEYTPAPPVKKEKVVKETVLKIHGEFKQTSNHMPLTEEMQAVIDKLKEGATGATVIREAYALVQETGINVAEFEKYSGINKGRIVGCLKKLKSTDE